MPQLGRDDHTFAVLDIPSPKPTSLRATTGLAAADVAPAHTRFEFLVVESPTSKRRAAAIAAESTKLLVEIQQAAARAVLLNLEAGQRPPTLALPLDQAEELLAQTPMTNIQNGSSTSSRS